jgi:hypothetical protein
VGVRLSFKVRFLLLLLSLLSLFLFVLVGKNMLIEGTILFKQVTWIELNIPRVSSYTYLISSALATTPCCLFLVYNSLGASRLLMICLVWFEWIFWLSLYPGRSGYTGIVCFM